MNDTASRKRQNFNREFDYCLLGNFEKKQIKKITLYYRSPEERFRRRDLLGKIGFKSLYWQEKEIDVEGENIQLEIEDNFVHIFFNNRQIFDSLTDYDCRTITKVRNLSRVSTPNPYEFRVPIHNLRSIEWE
ncbi:MAG: hypothetical protein ACM3PZ_03385 [Bacillota bacterium]